MGDRGNICITKPDGTPWVYLYTHWRGSDIVDLTRDALRYIAKEKRLDDPPYAQRMLTSQIIGEEWKDALGWGLYWDICDNEHDIVYINFDARTVKIGDASFDIAVFIR